MGRTTIRRGAGKRRVDGKSLRLADEVRYIQRRAADHDGRVVTVGQLVLFSTETGDAWLLDPADQLAARLARDGDPEPIHIEENDTTFAIGWKGRYRMQHQPALLLGRFDLYETHGWPLHRLGDRLGVGRIVLVALDVGLHVLRPSTVPGAKLRQFTRPIMGRGAGLHADQARRQRPGRASGSLATFTSRTILPVSSRCRRWSP